MPKYNLNNIDFIRQGENTLIGIHQNGVDCYYPWEKPLKPSKIKYVLMDLDGTSVKSEEFWVYIIEKTTATLLGDPSFRLKEEDAPYVQGFTTDEHLSYCKTKYGFKQSLSEASSLYHKIAREELTAAQNGTGRKNAFVPREGLKEFLLLLKSKGIKIGLVTSGLDYKAIPEIVAAFRELNMGDPCSFYDAIITGGRRKEPGAYGTTGELCSKPHPWVYKEIAAGLGVASSEEAIVIEDSSAGVISGKLAGFPVIGFKDGNIIKAGLEEDCYKMVDSFKDIENLL